MARQRERLTAKDRALRDERRRERRFLQDREEALRLAGFSEDRIDKELQDMKDSLDAVREQYAPATAEYEREKQSVIAQIRDIAAQLIANEGIDTNAAPELPPDGEIQAVDALPQIEDTPEPTESAPLQEPTESLENTQDPTTATLEVGDEPYQGNLDPADIDFDNFLDSNEVAVSSTNLASVNYDSSTGTLRISFHKGRGNYYYQDVSYTEYQGLILADSVGKYFHQRIKQKAYFIR